MLLRVELAGTGAGDFANGCEKPTSNGVLVPVVVFHGQVLISAIVGCRITPQEFSARHKVKGADSSGACVLGRNLGCENRGFRLPTADAERQDISSALGNAGRFKFD